MKGTLNILLKNNKQLMLNGNEIDQQNLDYTYKSCLY